MDERNFEGTLVLEKLARTDSVDEFMAAVDADPDHACAGRTAPSRLQRALDQASEHGLELPRMTAIARELSRD